MQVQSTELTRWHKKETQEREASYYGQYIPWTKNNINPILENVLKKYVLQYYQLKVGHGAVRTFLTKIRKIEIPQCWWCKEPIQLVEHLYAKCRRWRKEQKKLVRELEMERVRQ